MATRRAILSAGVAAAAAAAVPRLFAQQTGAKSSCRGRYQSLAGNRNGTTGTEYLVATPVTSGCSDESNRSNSQPPLAHEECQTANRGDGT
jgi:hypothetical protein